MQTRERETEGTGGREGQRERGNVRERDRERENQTRAGQAAVALLTCSKRMEKGERGKEQCMASARDLSSADAAFYVCQSTEATWESAAAAGETWLAFTDTRFAEVEVDDEFADGNMAGVAAVAASSSDKRR